MSVTFVQGNTPTVYDQAITQARRQERDKRMYRSPYGTTWRTEGSDDKRPEMVGVTIEAWGATAETDVDAIITAAENADALSTPYWTANVEGLVSAVVTPVRGAAYRVRVEMLTVRPAGYAPVLATEGGADLLTEGGATLGAEGV